MRSHYSYLEDTEQILLIHEGCECCMKLNLGCVTEKGDFRSKNQDRIMCKRGEKDGHLLAVACVCDGIGSLSESEMASQMMVDGIENWFDGAIRYYPKVMDREQLIDDLKFTICELNELIYEQREKSLGCTMSLIMLVDLEYWIFHVGDSCICCLRDMLFKMTQDEVVLRNINGRDKAFLINYIGKDKQLSLNMQHGKIYEQEIFVLGTDGLYKKLTYEDVQGIFEPLSKDDEVESACRKLIDLVMERGETDNISCAVLKVVERD